MDENAIQLRLNELTTDSVHTTHHDNSQKIRAILFLGQCMVVSAKIIAASITQIALQIYHKRLN